VSLLDVITHFAGEATYSVTRRAEGATVLGRASVGAPTTFTIEALVVPLSGKDLKVLPEGRRAEDSLKVISPTELKLGDIVTVRGEDWEVYHLEVCLQFGEMHCNAMVARQRSTPF
jgi:hypothetical protein